MDTIILEADVPVLYVRAESFPEGILAAHQALHSKVPFSTARRYFGLSRPEGSINNIVYRAAVEELTPGEGKALGLDSLLLRKGRYVSRTLFNFTEDIDAIGRTFDELLETPGLDPQGYCVEWYISERDMHCMIRLQD